MKLVQHQHAALTECLIAVRVDGAGSVFDPVAGAHHLLEHLVADQMYERISQLGGRFEAHTYLEYQTFSCAIPTDNATETLYTILQELSRANTKTWNDKRIRQGLKIMKRERLLHKRNPHENVMEKLDAAIFCKEYARPTTTIDLTQNFSDRMLAKLAKQAYVSNRITITAITPDAKSLKSITNVEKNISIQKGTFPRYPPCQRQVREITVTSPLSKEAFIRLDFPGLDLKHTNHYINNFAIEMLTGPYGILEKPLGESGFALCYDLFTNVAVSYNYSQISFGAACLPKDIDTVKKIIKEQIRTFPRLPHLELLEYTEQITNQEINRLNQDPYALFDFLLLFSFAKMQQEPEPKDLLCHWMKNKSLDSIHAILDTKKMSIVTTKKEHGSNRIPR